MAFHSEIKINYQVLQDIVDSFKGYETALNDMQIEQIFSVIKDPSKMHAIQ